MFNYLDVSEEIRQKCEKLCKENNYEFLTVMRLSNHPDDDFLYVVVAVNPNHPMKEYRYASWIYNGRGLDGGYYFGSFKKIMAKAVERLNEIQSVCYSCKYYEQCGSHDRIHPCMGKEEVEYERLG